MKNILNEFRKDILAILITIILISQFALVVLPVEGEEPLSLKYDRTILIEKWRTRIQSFLDANVIPLVDLESSLRRRDGEKYLDDAMMVMDKLGLAIIAFDGYQAPKESEMQKGYRWGYYIHSIVNDYPHHFVLATNGGTNKNWLQQKISFVDQTVKHVRGGNYPIMGEFDFRHYMSHHQCKAGKTERDNDIPINSANGHRIFTLSEETGIAFVIHLEPEDRPLTEMEEMLAAYPRAKVIWAHFGQIRHQERQKKYTPKLIHRLLSTYSNLCIDISTGHPGRRYKCNNNILDTVIWQDGFLDSQKSILKPEFKAILAEFSNRFVVGTDYGDGRPPLPEFLKKKIKNVRLIMRDLPAEAKHNIGYRNAWFLLTGKPW